MLPCNNSLDRNRRRYSSQFKFCMEWHCLEDETGHSLRSQTPLQVPHFENHFDVDVKPEDNRSGRGKLNVRALIWSIC